MKKCFAVKAAPMATDFGLLFLRLFVGYAFIHHGWGKIQNPMAWMPEGTPIPGILQLLAAVSEFGGGIALILGLLTRLASLGLFFTMLVAAAFHISNGDSVIHTGQGAAAEPALVYMFIALLFTLHGPGRHSVDKILFR